MICSVSVYLEQANMLFNHTVKGVSMYDTI